MSGTNRTTLFSDGGTVVFGTGTFVLSQLKFGAPALADGTVGERTAEIVGYILPAGGNEAIRRAAMERARRLLCRTVSRREGFTLVCGGRSMRMTAAAAPDFASEAPLNGADAACFTLRCVSAEDGAFSGDEVTAVCRGLLPSMTFPLAFTGRTVFASLARTGTTHVENAGDLPCGFAAEITAAGGALTAVTLTLDGQSLTVRHPLEEGETLLIDTRVGQKDVRCGGVSVMEDVDRDSTFFSLAAGENRLDWESEGFGSAVMRLRFTPRYL